MRFAGARGITRSRVPLIAMLALAGTIGLAGCEGDDGRDGATGPTGPASTVPGPTGPQGPEGPAGQPVVQKPLESCAVCHDAGSVYAVDDAHALTGLASVSNVVFADVSGDLRVTYNLKLDGQAAADFLDVESQYRVANGVFAPAGAPAQATYEGSGNYSITIPGGVAAAGAASRYFLRVVSDTAGAAAVVSGDFPAAAYTDVVTDQSCNNCHSDAGVAPHTAFGYPGMKVSECVVCHTPTSGTPPFFDFKDSFVGIVHGIHAAHDRPSGKYVYEEPNYVYETTYPTYMTNCSVCHEGATNLAAANSMTVSGANCFTCHESMEAWDFTETGTTFHEAYTEATNCTTCHSPGNIAPATVTAFHNSLETERVGIIWNGEDLSVTEGKNFTWKIDNVADDGTNLKITWSATYKTLPVDPCNITIGANAPLFHRAPAGTVLDGSLGFLRSYAQGDDFILGTSTSAPGQPRNDNLSDTNTTCSGNVATTTLAVEAGIPAGTRGILALQGKPQLPLPAGFDNPEYLKDVASNLYVRVPTPTAEWIVGSSGLVPSTADRRDIVDTEVCLKCHVGSLYQHGNTRVDNVGMCILCHNPASSEQNVRVGMGVDKSEAYDGLVGQTYEMKTMLHAIHSAGIPGASPIVIYRNRGIYAWATDESLLPNWDAATACQVVSPIPPATTPAAFVDVAPFEAIPAGMRVTTIGNIVNGARTNADGSYPTVTCQVHNFHTPTYPRAINDCAACHGAKDFDLVPDQSKAVATTLDAGKEPWNNKLDDVLQGAGAAACTSCHSTSIARGHAYQNGWNPAVFPNGRQTILDEAK